MKQILLFISLSLITFAGFSQSKGISYQAVIIDPNPIELPGQDIVSQPYVSKDVWIKFGIYSGSTLQYEELQKTKTDEFGLVNLIIGSGINSGQAGTFTSLKWDGPTKNIVTSVSFDQGARYTQVSNQRLNFVPYTFLAEAATRLTDILPVSQGGTGAVSTNDAKVNFGLDKVNNTADADKPVSLATLAILDIKESLLNKSQNIIADSASIVKYPSVKAIKDYIDNRTSLNASQANNANLAAKATALETARTINGVPFDGTANITIPLGVTPPDADATTKGLVQLAGDLSGTAAAPSIADGAVGTVKLADASVTNAKIVSVAGSKVTGDIAGNAATATLAATATSAEKATKLTTSRTINGVAFDGTADITIPVGVTPVDADAMTKGILQLAGDLSGTAASPSIAAGAVGTAKLADASVSSGKLAMSSVTTEKLADASVTNAKIVSVAGSKVTGDIAGNAATATLATTAFQANNATLASSATKLATPRNINGVPFDGTSDITITTSSPTLSGTIAIANGGTGATTAAGARTNLGLAIGTDVLAQRTFGSAANNNTADFVATTEKGANNGVATLGNNGKIPSVQIPAISFQNVNVVNSDATMIAIFGAQVGSIAIRTDNNQNYVLSALPASTLSNWIQLATPTSVTSVNGYAGPNVVLTTNDVATSANRNYVTNTQASVLSNTSGVNTGDQTITLTNDVVGAGTGTFATTVNSVGGVSSATIATFPGSISTLTGGFAANVNNISYLNTQVNSHTVSLTTNATDIATLRTSISNLGAEPTLNKSTATDLGNSSPSDILFPTQKAVKTYVDMQSANAGVADGSISNVKLAGGITYDKLAGSIPASKLVGTDIATVGTITSGVWSGTVIGSNVGGAGSVNGLLKANGSGVVSAAISGMDYQAPILTAPTTNQFLTSAAGGTYTWTSAAVGVPYTGATGAVDLGAYDLTVNGITIGKGTGAGNTNTALGNGVITVASTGSGGNTAVGYHALKINNATGNTAVGYNALSSYAGSSNAAFGYNALALTTSSSNSAFGTSALAVNTSGTNNAAFGTQALLANTTASGNAAFGPYSLVAATTGSFNTGVGYNALGKMTNTANNVALGYNAGAWVSGGSVPNLTPSNSIYIGHQAYPRADAETNQIVIGAGAVGNGSNTVTIGNLSNTATYFTGAINVTGNVNGGTWSGTAIDVAHGGTGALTAASARTNLGLAIGTDVMAANATTTLTGDVTGTGNASLTTTVNSVGGVSSATIAMLPASISLHSTNIASQTVSITALNALTTASNNPYIATLPFLNRVGTITTGVWSGTAIDVAHGGTGLTSPGASGNVLTSNGTNWVSSATSAVPYTGATGAVNLGAYDLTVNSLTVGLGGSNIASNTALGAFSLYNNTTGSYNSGLGNQSMQLNTDGIFNTAIGAQSLFSNLSGGNNAALGMRALYVNTSSGNTSIGSQSALNNTTGAQNTVLGYKALQFNATGSNNVVLGALAGPATINTTTPTNGIFIGYSAAPKAVATSSDEIVIGANATGNGSNTVTIGNSSNTKTYLSGDLAVSGNITAGTISLTTNIKTSGTLTAGTVTYPNTYGTNGQVLSSTGTGTLTWTTASGGSSTTHAIGDSYGGGTVFYVYDGGAHGLIVSNADLNGGAVIRWSGQYTNSRALADGVGAGLKNTMLIIAANATYDANAFAASLCNEYSVTQTVNGITTTYGDWYLPSKYELGLLYTNKVLAGNLNLTYWSSTEVSGSTPAYYYAWKADFSGSSVNYVSSLKTTTTATYVRAVRAF